MQLAGLLQWGQFLRSVVEVGGVVVVVACLSDQQIQQRQRRELFRSGRKLSFGNWARCASAGGMPDHFVGEEKGAKAE